MSTEVAAGTPAHLSNPDAPDPPRLSRQLFEAEPGQTDEFRTKLEKAILAGDRGPIDLKNKATFVKDLQDLLGHVEERLKMGPKEAWLSAEAYRSPADGTPNTELFDHPEEKWARAFTEVFTFLMYGGPGVHYGPAGAGGDSSKYLSDKDFFSSFPTVYPLVIACQHQATFAVLSRGNTVSDVGAGGLGCNGASADLPAFKGNEAAKPAQPARPAEPAKDGEPAKEAVPAKPAELAKGGQFATKAERDTTSEFLPIVGPGDAIFFNFRGPTSTDQNPGRTGESIHVGSVLRKWGSRLQFFDTGAMMNPGTSGVTDGGTTDHDWAAETLDPFDDTVGVGRLGAAPGDLEDLAEKTVKSRPVALARLFVFDEVESKVQSWGTSGPIIYSRALRARYVSPLLHLWLDGRGVHVTHLMWATRKPPVSGLRLGWYVYLPKGQWGRKFLDDGVVDERPDALFTRKVDYLYMCNIVFGLKDGRVTVGRRFAAKKADKDSKGWTFDFNNPKIEFEAETEFPSDQKCWVKLRAENDRTPDAKVPGGEMHLWAAEPKNFGKLYALEPDQLIGVESTHGIGAGFFDQGLGAPIRIPSNVA